MGPKRHISDTRFALFSEGLSSQFVIDVVRLETGPQVARLPLNLLPPSRGVRLARTPPVSISAVFAGSFITISEVESAAGH